MLDPLDATALRDEHSGRDETCNLLFAIAELGQNLGAVYTESRRRSSNAARCPGHLHRDARTLVAVEVNLHLTVVGMRVLEQLLNVEDRPGRDAELKQRFAERDTINLRQQPLELNAQLGAIDHAIGIVKKSRILG